MDNLKWSKDALKFLKKHPLEGSRFRESFKELVRDWSCSYKFDISLMKNWEAHKEGYEVLRLRIGKYRAIFERSLNHKDIYIFIVDINSRGGIYK